MSKNCGQPDTTARHKPIFAKKHNLSKTKLYTLEDKTEEATTQAR